MRPLAGKSALVTGAARGIGRAIALRLAARGVRLALADLDAEGLARTVGEVRVLGVEAHAHRLDLCDPREIDRLIAALLDRWAGVDLLVNNAGVAHYGPTAGMTRSQIDRLLAVNLAAPVQLIHGLLPAMLARPESHLLNVSSVLGLTAMPKTALYCASKFGLVGLGDALRAEYGRSGLGVTTLCPGFVETDLIHGATGGPSSGRRPPGLFCVNVDRVCDAAIRGVERNRRRVVVDPVGRWVRAAISATPWLYDSLQSLGRKRRMAKKLAELRGLDPNLEAALRQKLGTGPSAPERRAA